MEGTVIRFGGGSYPKSGSQFTVGVNPLKQLNYNYEKIPYTFYREIVKGEFVTDGIMQRSELVKKAQFFGLYEELKASFKGA